MAKAKKELLSISKLAFRFSLDRATVRLRLMEAGIAPTEERAKEKLYEMTAEVEECLKSQSKPMDAAKLRKTEAEAEIKEIEASRKKGETASVADFTEAVQSIFGAMHKKIAVQFPKNISARLSKCSTQKEIAEILSKEIGKIFSDLRDDHRKYLK